MSRIGMDIDAVVGFARRLENDAASEIGRLIPSLSGTVSELMDYWKGDDATAFQQKWDGYASDLGKLQSAIGDLVWSLNGAVSAQRAASDE